MARWRDDELITRLLLGLGYTAPPCGPARVSKHGMVSLARQTGRPISPLGFSARPCIRFRSWDGTLLPLPFARVLCVYGPAISVPRDAEPDEEETIRHPLDRELNRLTDEADDRCGRMDENRATPEPAGSKP